MTLIWPSLIILHSPTSKLVYTVLHFKNTSSDRSLSDILALFRRSTMPLWLVHLKPEWQMYTADISLSYVALLQTQKSICRSKARP